MTVCQFFLQGRCRFGQNCRFDHPFNDDRNSRNQVNSQQLSNVIKQILDEVISAEKGGQWPLSCFSPLKGGSNIPGWEDVSPEEVRWKMYEARAKGTLNECNLEINQFYNNAEKMRNLIKEPTMERVNLIVNALRGKGQPSNSSGQFNSSPSSTSFFGGSPQSAPTQNIFSSSATSSGNHGSIFGGSSPSGSIFGSSTQLTGNIFGNSTTFSNQNIFGGSNSSNTFTQSTFSNQQNPNQNLFSKSPSLVSGRIFSNTPVSSQNIFAKPVEGTNQNSNIFLSQNSSGTFSNQGVSSPIFGSNNTFFQNSESSNQNSPNIFGANQNENIFKPQNASNMFDSQKEPSNTAFGGSVQQNSFIQHTVKEFDYSVYSKLEDLSEEEVKSFTSTTFAFGKIPLKPPPKEYCK